jgi:hypothetical protein
MAYETKIRLLTMTNRAPYGIAFSRVSNKGKRGSGSRRRASYIRFNSP